MKKIRFIVAVLLGVQSLCAQQVLRIADVFGSVENDLRIQQNADLQSTVQGLRMHDPLLQQVRLRLGVNGSALGDTIYGYLRNEDTYQIQIGFGSLQERRRQQQIKTTRIARLSAETRVLRQKATAQRLEPLAALLYTEPQLAACRRLDSLYEKQQQILQKMLESEIFEVKVSKIVATEADRERNQATIQALQNRILLEKAQLEQFVGPFAALDRNNAAHVTDLRAHFVFLKNITTDNNPLFALYAADVATQQAELDYVSAQNRQIFDHFQAGYQRPLYLERPKRFNTFNNVSFRVGFTVPITANNRFKQSNALLDVRKAQNEAAWVRQEVLTDQSNRTLRLDQLLSEYAQTEERRQSSLIKKMLNNPTLLAQISPLEIVEMEIAQQQQIVRQAALLADIGGAWAAYLESIGVEGAGVAQYFLKK
jgi:hypothetical protein